MQAELVDGRERLECFQENGETRRTRGFSFLRPGQQVLKGG